MMGTYFTVASSSKTPAHIKKSDVEVTNIRSINTREISNAGFNVGMCFKPYVTEGKNIPNVYARPFMGNKAYLFFVVLQDGTVRECYLGQFSRAVTKFNGAMPVFKEDGTPERVIAGGDVCDMWKSFGNAEDALKAITAKCNDGYHIKVTNRQTVHTFIRQRGQEPQERDQIVYDFNFEADSELSE